MVSVCNLHRKHPQPDIRLSLFDKNLYALYIQNVYLMSFTFVNFSTNMRVSTKNAARFASSDGAGFYVTHFHILEVKATRVET